MRTRQTTPVALTLEAVESAAKVFDENLPGWRLSDLALQELAKKVPGHDQPSALIKASVVNALYGTNVYAVVRAARHIAETLSDANLRAAGPELVEAMAAIPGLKGHRVSFASKYAHFFINADRFPIYDSVARSMLRLHVGGPEISTYPVFVEKFNGLCETLGLTDRPRQLDRYLWLSGLGLELKRSQRALVNTEVRDYYARHTSPAFLPSPKKT